MQKPRLHAPLWTLVGVLALTLPALAQPAEPTAPETAPQPSPTPSEEEPTTQSGAAAVESEPQQSSSLAAAEKIVPQVVIHVNGTADEGDDLVQWSGSNLVAADSTTRCSIYLANAAEYGTQSVTIVLNNSSDNIDFVNQDINGHLTLSLSGANDETNPQTFSITGKSRNSTANATKINAHENNVYTAIVGTEDLTVYWFGEDNVSLQNISGFLLYSLADPNRNPVYSYGPNNRFAVEMRAQSVAKPTGIDMNAPQLKKWRVGVVQNVVSANYTMRCADPYIAYMKRPCCFLCGAQSEIFGF